MQLTALLKLLTPSKQLLVIQQPGTGKSHIYRMVGTILHDIHIVFHPLLVLTADQIIKFKTGSNIYGAIEVHNLNEHASKSIQFRGKLLSWLKGLVPDSTTTIFLFTSPQFLTKYQAFCTCLVQLSWTRGTLRACILDEAHLLSQHGADFRPEIRQLGDIFFQLAFSPSNNCRGFFVAGTATMTRNNLKYLESIASIQFTPDTTFWATAAKFKIAASKLLFIVALSILMKQLNISNGKQVVHSFTPTPKPMPLN